MKHILVASGWCERPDGSILLVQQTNRRGTFWSPPGGKVDHGEGFTEGLRREFTEETAITHITVDELIYTVEGISDVTRFLTMVFKVTVPTDAEPRIGNDPDGHITRAEFVPRDLATEYLQSNPLVHVREPIADYLAGCTNRHVLYRTAPGSDDFTKTVRVATLS